MTEPLGALPNNLKRAWSICHKYFNEHDVQTSFRNEWSPEFDILSSKSSLDEGGNENVHNAGGAAEHKIYDEDAEQVS
jgi:hypothetical protein